LPTKSSIGIPDKFERVEDWEKFKWLRATDLGEDVDAF